MRSPARFSRAIQRLTVLMVSCALLGSSLLGAAPAAYAASGSTIEVLIGCPSTSPGQSLILAMEATQDGNAGGECTGLSTNLNGPYVLVLNPSDTYTLSTDYIAPAGTQYADSSDAGPTALPDVTGDVTVESASSSLAVITRVGSTPFRIFDVLASGSLTLNHVSLQGGLAQGGNGAGGGGGGAGLGGAIFSHGGAVTIENSQMIGNSAHGGNGAPMGSGSGGGGGMGGNGGNRYSAGGGEEAAGGGGGTVGNGQDGAAPLTPGAGGLNGGGAGGFFSPQSVGFAQAGGFGGGGGGSGMDAPGAGGFGGGAGGGDSHSFGGIGGFFGGAGASPLEQVPPPSLFGGGDGGKWGGGGGAGAGGAIFMNGGDLTIASSTFQNNGAVGGAGAGDGGNGNGYGGAIFANGFGVFPPAPVTMSIRGSTFENNSATQVAFGSPSVDGNLVLGGLPRMASLSPAAIGNQVVHTPFGTSVGIYDANGNIGDTPNTSVTLSVYSGPGGGTLSGTTTVTSTSGLAQFSGLSLSTPGTYVLQASAGTFTALTQPFTVGSALPARMVLTPSASYVPEGGSIAVTGTVYDSGGNPVQDATLDLTASTGSLASTRLITNHQGVFSTPYTAPANTTGPVTFRADLSIGRILLSSSAAVTVTGRASVIGIHLSPSMVSISNPFTVSGSVYDQHGNPVPDAVVQVTAGGAFPGGRTSVTQSVYTNTQGAYTARFTAPSSPGPVLITSTANGVAVQTSAVLAVASSFGGASAYSSNFTAGSNDVTVGGPGSAVPDIIVTAAGGAGGLSVVQYGTNPVSQSPTKLAAPTYWDAGLTQSNRFTHATITVCNIPNAESADWYDNGSWTTVSSVYRATNGCLILGPFTSQSSPGLSDLTGTVFAVGAPAVGGRVNPTPLNVTTTSLPGGTVGTGYSATLGATGGVGPTTWKVTGGALPAGLSLNGNTIRGTPTAAGTSNFAVTVTDSVYHTDTANLSITVAAGSSTGGSGGVVAIGGGGGGFGPPSTNPITSNTATAIIGETGGTVATVDHSVTLQIPPGAFTRNVTVTVQVESPSQVASVPQEDTAVSVVSIHSGGNEPLKPATITLAYSPTMLADLSPNRLGVYYENPSNRSWTWVGGEVDASNDTMTVTLPHFSTYAVLENTAQFTDMNQAAWAKPYVDTLLGAGIVKGVSSGVFDPNGPLTRAQFTKLLVLADGLSPVASGSTSFTDVPASSWFAPYVAVAEQAGVVNGISATTFDPNAPITRQEMAVMLARLLKKMTVVSNPVSFSDASSIATWATSGVQQVVANGLMDGFPNGSFEPDGISTRAQAAAVIARYLQSVGKV